jgi:RND family efflux transporter MFP subunit
MHKFAIAILSLSSALISYEAIAAGRPAPAVTTYEVKPQQLDSKLYTIGTLKSDKATQIRTEVAGKVTDILFSAGQKISKGEIVAKLDKREATALLTKLEAQLTLAKQQLQRQEQLIKNRAAPIEQRDIRLAEVAGLEASIAIAKLDLSKLEIKAPFTGYIGSSTIVAGEWLNANSSIATLDATDSLTLSFAVPEKHLDSIKPGTEVSLSSVAWPDRAFAGIVNYIATRVNQDRGTIDVEAIIDNKDQMLRPGMSVKVSLAISKNENALLVPARSVTYQGDKATVMRIGTEGKVKPVTVSIGAELEEWIEVTEGLNIGDKIVDRGRLKAKPNRPVRELGEKGSKS